MLQHMATTRCHTLDPHQVNLEEKFVGWSDSQLLPSEIKSLTSRNLFQNSIFLTLRVRMQDISSFVCKLHSQCSFTYNSFTFSSFTLRSS